MAVVSRHSHTFRPPRLSPMMFERPLHQDPHTSHLLSAILALQSPRALAVPVLAANKKQVNKMCSNMQGLLLMVAAAMLVAGVSAQQCAPGELVAACVEACIG